MRSELEEARLGRTLPASCRWPIRVAMGTATSGRRIPQTARPVAGSRSMDRNSSSGIVRLSRGALGGEMPKRTQPVDDEGVEVRRPGDLPDPQVLRIGLQMQSATGAAKEVVLIRLGLQDKHVILAVGPKSGGIGRIDEVSR